MKALAGRSFAALLVAAGLAGACHEAVGATSDGVPPTKQPNGAATEGARPPAPKKSGASTVGAAAVGALLGALAQEGRNQKLRDQLNALGQRIDQLDAENRQLRDQLADANRQAGDNRRLRDQLDATTRQQAAEANAAQQRLQGEAARTRAAQQEAARRLTAAQQAHAAEVGQLRTELDAATLELAAARDQLRILRERWWWWIALAGAFALAAGMAAARALWPRRIEVPLSATVTLGPWSLHAHPAPAQRLPGFGVQARLALVHSQVRPVQPPLLRPAA